MKMPSLSSLWGGSSVQPTTTTTTATTATTRTTTTTARPALDAVGFGAPVDSAGLKPGSPLRFTMALTPSDARSLESADGVVTAGHGVLTGELALRDVQSTSPMFAATTQQQAVLITANLGKRHEVSFALDLPPAEAKRLIDRAKGTSGADRGHVRVQIEGDFQGGDARGTAQHCRLSTSSLPPLYLSVGDTLQASGRIVHVYQTGSDRGIPLGHYLELTTPIQVDGVEVTEVYLPGADALSLQQLVSINEPLRFGRFTDKGQAVAFVELDRLERFHRAGDPPRMLDRETLANISDVGGWRVEGHGTLEGRIDIDTRDGREVAVLVTSARGRAQKAFALDVPVDEVRQHVGHGARVKGLIVHDGRDNRIMAPTLKAVADPPVHQFGDVVQVQGMVCHQWINDDTGTSRQTASLVLAEPILLGDRRVQQFRLDTAVSLDSGTKLRLEGTLTAYDTPSSTGARLDGVALRDVKNLRQAADMDAFAIVHDELSEDFPFRTSPRLRVRVPDEQ